MNWLQLTFQLDAAANADSSEQLSELLTEMGSSAVTIQDAEDQPIYEPPPGATPLWQALLVTGLFEEGVDLDKILDAVKQSLGELPEHQVKVLEDQDWVRSWMDDFQPMRFGQRLWICPSWHQAPDPDAVNILLDPGLAFGTGTHPTTALCLEWLDQNQQTDELVIDYGCGSGILAIAALKLGARHVHAVDLDYQAIQATQDNAEKNGQLEKLNTYTPDTFYKQNTNLQCDLLLANILAGPLVELAEQLAALVKSNGQIVLSGILAEQSQKIVQAYSPWFDLDPIQQKEDWIRVTGTKR